MASASDAIPPPPPLMKLLRQLSSDARTGVVSADQKSKIKAELLHAADSKSAPAATAVDTKANGTAAAAPKSAAANGGGDESIPPPPLLPLLRQLSACARDGLIDAQQKSHIKSLLLSGSVSAAKQIIDQKSKPVKTLVLSVGGSFLSPEAVLARDEQKRQFEAKLLAERTARADEARLAAAARLKAKVEAERKRARAALQPVAGSGAAGASGGFRAAALNVLQPRAAPASVHANASTPIMIAARDVLSIIFSYTNGDDALMSVSGVCRGWHQSVFRDREAAAWRRRCVTEYFSGYGANAWDLFGVSYWVRTYRMHRALALTARIQKEAQSAGPTAPFRPPVANKLFTSPLFNVFGPIAAPRIKLWKHPLFAERAWVAVHTTEGKNVAMYTHSEKTGGWGVSGMFGSTGWHDAELVPPREKRAIEALGRGPGSVQLWVLQLGAKRRVTSHPLSQRLVLELAGEPLLTLSFGLGLVASRQASDGVAVYAFDPNSSAADAAAADADPNVPPPRPRALWAVNFPRSRVRSAHFYALPLPLPSTAATAKPNSAAGVGDAKSGAPASSASAAATAAAASELSTDSPHPGLAGIVLAVLCESGEVALFDALTGRLRAWNFGPALPSANGGPAVPIALPFYQKWMDTRRLSVLNARMAWLRELEAKLRPADGSAMDNEGYEPILPAEYRYRLNYVDRAMVEVELERTDLLAAQDQCLAAIPNAELRERVLAWCDSPEAIAASRPPNKPHVSVCYGSTSAMYDVTWPYPLPAVSSSSAIPTQPPAKASGAVSFSSTPAGMLPAPFFRPMLVRAEEIAGEVKPVVVARRGAFSTTAIDPDEEKPLRGTKTVFTLVDVASGKASKPFQPQEPTEADADYTLRTNVYWYFLYSPKINPHTGLPFVFAAPPTNASASSTDEKKAPKRSIAEIGATAGPVVVTAHANGDILITNLIGKSVELLYTPYSQRPSSYEPAWDESSGLFMIRDTHGSKPNYLWNLNHSTAGAVKQPIATIGGPYFGDILRYANFRLTPYGVSLYSSARHRHHIQPWSALASPASPDMNERAKLDAVYASVVREGYAHSGHQLPFSQCDNAYNAEVTAWGEDRHWQYRLPMRIDATDFTAMADDSVIVREYYTGAEAWDGDSRKENGTNFEVLAGGRLRYRIYSLNNARRTRVRSDAESLVGQIMISPPSVGATPIDSNGKIGIVTRVEGNHVKLRAFRTRLWTTRFNFDNSKFVSTYDQLFEHAIWTNAFGGTGIPAGAGLSTDAPAPIASASAAADAKDIKSDVKSPDLTPASGTAAAATGSSKKPKVAADSDFARQWVLCPPVPHHLPPTKFSLTPPPPKPDYKIGEPLLLVNSWVYDHAALRARAQSAGNAKGSFHGAHKKLIAANVLNEALRTDPPATCLSIVVHEIIGPMLVYRLLEDEVSGAPLQEPLKGVMNWFGAIQITSNRLVRPPTKRGSVKDALLDVWHACATWPPRADSVRVMKIQAGWL